MNPQAEQGIKINPDHVNNSLANQIAELSLKLAQFNAVITAQAEVQETSDKRIKELEMENKQLHEGKETDKKEVKK